MRTGSRLDSKSLPKPSIHQVAGVILFPWARGNHPTTLHIPLPQERRVHANVSLAVEDQTTSGSSGMPRVSHHLGVTCWRLSGHGFRHGVTRMVMESEGPFRYPTRIHATHATSQEPSHATNVMNLSGDATDSGASTSKGCRPRGEAQQTYAICPLPRCLSDTRE